jgi:hypothetical protein
MNIIIYEAQGHPFWQEGEHTVDVDGKQFDVYSALKCEENGWHCTNYKLEVRSDGIYAQHHHCSSGGGRQPFGEFKKVLAISPSDSVRRAGVPMEKFREDPMEREMLGPNFHTGVIP